MTDIKKYKAGDIVWSLGRTQCTVLHNTLKPGGVNLDEAVLFLRSIQKTSIVVPVAFQDLFISDKRIGFLEKWPRPEEKE